jgi:hypothetical protein
VGDVIPNESAADSAASATEVAVTVGLLLGDAGVETGGVYEALRLGEPMAESVPQVGAHAVPLAASVHVTPEFEGSFATVTLRVTAAAPALMVVIEFVNATVLGALIVKESDVLFVVSVTEVAVIVGALFGAAGKVAGGV